LSEHGWLPPEKAGPKSHFGRRMLRAPTCTQFPSVTAFTSSFWRGGCLMDKDKHLTWEANDAIPTALAQVAAICLWGFVASAATIYSSTLAHEIQNKSVLLALQAKS
jgi:hypothetical protein